MAWTCLLECSECSDSSDSSDSSLYVGSTTGLDRRLAQHHAGAVAAYTRTRRPLRLLWAGEFARVSDAYALERQMHGWSRAKKLALARGQFERLPLLSSRSYAAGEARERTRDEDGPRRT